MVTATATVQKFKYLFRGRTDAWGAVHGEAMKQDITEQDWLDHIEGDGSLGIYPLVATPGGWRVPWGCTDIDNAANPEATLPLAKNLHKVLRLLGITSWVERTKGKGYHVWVFVEGWADAEAMRNCLLFAHQVAGVAPTEVNPKQTTADKLGNYVNIPYSRTFALRKRRVVIDLEHGEEMDLDTFVDRAMASLNSATKIAEVAQRYVPPKPPKRVAVGEYDGDLEPLVQKLQNPPPGKTRLAYRIFMEGVLEGRDRSGTLQRFAHLCFELGSFTPAEALALLTDLDLRHGKFFDRADGEMQLERMISNAWSKSQ